MATDDRQVLVAGIASAPATFTIPGNGQITPRSIFAHFDGTLAATSYQPAIKVTSDGGKLVGVYPTSTTVAAGASADVSWFPGGRLGSSGGTQQLVGARIQATSTQTITTSTSTDTVYQSVFFDTDGMANLAADNRILTVNTAGLYLVISQSLWAYNGAGRRINEVIQNDYATTSNIPSQFFSDDDRPANWSPVGGDGFGGPRTTNSSVGLFQASVGDFFSSGVYQNSGGNLNVSGFANCFLSAVLVGS